MRERFKRVAFFSEQAINSARGYYRGTVPEQGFKELGWRVNVSEILYEQADHTWNSYIPNETVRQLTPHFIVANYFLTPVRSGSADAPMELVWQSQQEVIEGAIGAGQKFFFDIDDDVWDVPTYNPRFNDAKGIRGHLKEFTEDINRATALICSTPGVAESAKYHGVKVPIHVVKNCIKIPRSAGIERPLHDPIRLGYVGVLEYREQDFNVVIPGLKKGLERFRDRVEFWHLGAALESGKKSIRDLLRPFPVDIVERPWVLPASFQNLLGELDYCILPSCGHSFNDGRSNIVGLECMAAGVPFAASRIAEYVALDTYIACTVGSLNDESTWAAQINTFIEWTKNQNLINWRTHAQEVLLNNFTPKHMAESYVKVFEKYE